MNASTEKPGTRSTRTGLLLHSRSSIDRPITPRRFHQQTRWISAISGHYMRVPAAKYVLVRGLRFRRGRAPWLRKTTATKVETVTLRHLSESLSEAHELPKKQVNAMLEDMVSNITKHLKKGARIRIGGLGILQVRKRAARMGRNPGHRRADQDQGQQEGGVPRRQGAERVGLGRPHCHNRASRVGTPRAVLRLKDDAAVQASHTCRRSRCRTIRVGIARRGDRADRRWR